MDLLRCALAGGLAALVLAGPAWGAAVGGEGPGGTISVGASDGSTSPGASGGPAGIGGTGTPSPGTGGGSGSAGGSPWICTYTSLVLNDEGGFPSGGPTPGGWYSVTCVNRLTGASATRTEWITRAPPGAPVPAAPIVPSVDPRALAVRAENSLTLPPPSLHFNPAWSSVVNLPTWLWIDGGIWHDYSVTASAGAVSATAVAVPESVTWVMGDGGAVECPGPGRPFDPARPALEQRTGCAYTYRTSSLGQRSPGGDANDAAYPVTARITWAVSWSAVGAPGEGVLPPLGTSAAASVRVVQVESLVTGTVTGPGPSRLPGPGVTGGPATDGVHG